MLPFLTTKRETGVIVQDRHPDENPSDESDAPDGKEALQMAMKPLLKAIQAQDIEAMAQAFHDAFQIAEILPHIESGDMEE